MREYIKVPAHKLHVSEKLNYEQLALVETLGIGAHAVERANVQSNDLVLVVGAWPIGLSVLEFVKLRGAKVAVVDRNTRRLDFCETKKPMLYVANDQTGRTNFGSIWWKNANSSFGCYRKPCFMHQSFNYFQAGGRLVLLDYTR
jgi:threonine dehydrogenase-like Zn-dependent dehydrogenase